MRQTISAFVKENDQSDKEAMLSARQLDLQKIKHVLLGTVTETKMQDNIRSMEAYFGEDGYTLCGDPEKERIMALWFGTLCPQNGAIQLWSMARLLVHEVIIPMGRTIRELEQSVRTLTLALDNKEHS